LSEDKDEDELLRTVALQNAQSILLARRRAEDELIRAKEALERKTAELAQSLSMMRATLESTFDGILVTDHAGKVTGFNEKYLEMFRVPHSIIHTADHEALVQFISTQVQDSGRFLDEMRAVYVSDPEESFDLLEFADGRIYERFSKIQRVGEERVGRVWTFRDITERRRAESAVLEGAQRLQLALSAGNLGDWSWDAQSDLLMLSPQAAEIFGLARDVVITWTQLQELVYDEDRERARIGVQQALLRHIDCDIEYRIDRPAGGCSWIAARGRGIYADDGRVQGMTGVIQDISARKSVEEALQDETRILELLNSTGASIASELDLDALVQTVTDAATHLSGAKFGAFFYNVIDEQGESFLLYSLSGAPREAFASFGLPRNTPVFDPTFRGERVVRSPDITQDVRYGTMAPHHGMPKGHLPVRSYLAVPVISRSGEVIGGLFFGHPETGIFTERTERIIVGVAAQAAVAIDNARLYEAAHRAAEERNTLLESERTARNAAERMSEMKDLFLANLSHELRTPLNAIVGWSQVLRRGAKDAADLQQGLEAIERNARMQTQLIEDLLDMSRITSGKVRLDVQPIAPISFIEAAIETVRPAADAKAIRLEKMLDPVAGPVSGDPGRLQQVIWNLLSNAIKFTPRGGKVQVVLECVNSHIEISVADTGIGIEPAFLPHVFERFRQADASSTRSYGGLGLGLSIAKHLVELHGGTVHVRSLGVGQGTTFAVHLPLAVVHRSGASEERLHPRTPVGMSTDFKTLDLSGIKVLVVDDEVDARDVIKRVLMECRADVFTAADAAEALRLVEKERPHVLVSDIGMPEVDGYELLKRMRILGESRGGKIPAIALTAFARSQDRTRALRAGFLAHVSKPVEPAELVATVASVSGRSSEQVD
jgi:PAS domain S-box-containing protein